MFHDVGVERTSEVINGFDVSKRSLSDGKDGPGTLAADIKTARSGRMHTANA